MSFMDDKVKPTLEFFLRPYRVKVDELRREHGSLLCLATKLLGVTPRHYQYSALWPPGLETMNVVMCNMLNLPFCDLGVGSIGGSLRSLIAYVASRAYGCNYCSAQYATLGTLVRGSGVFLNKNASAMDARESDGIFSRRELEAINIAKKVGSVACKVGVEDMQRLAKVFSAKEQEAVVNAVAASGFFNRFMDTMGMTLEKEAMALAEEKLAASGWSAGITYDDKFDAELLAEDQLEATQPNDLKKQGGLLSIVKMSIGINAANTETLGKLPSSDSVLFGQCMDVAGFVPYYLRKCLHANTKNTLAWAFLQQLNEGSVELDLNESSSEVSKGVKQMMCYLCATNAKNTILRAHFAFMAYRSGISIQRLVHIVESAGEDDNYLQKDEAAFMLAQATSFTPSKMTSTLVRYITNQYSPAGVLELVITVSLVSMLHRWTAVYVPTTYEPEIAVFVRKHGHALKIDADSPCTPEQAGFEEARTRSSFFDEACFRC